jgi:uncharacterized coiled-coil protein SlyX
MSDSEDKINDAPESARPALMNLEHRIVRLERTLHGDEEAGVEGLGKCLNALEKELATVRGKLETLLTKLSVIAGLAAIVLPVLTRIIEKTLGF